MENMFKKVVNPCRCMVYTSSGERVMRDAFVKIEFDKDSNLSISGVIAPTTGGNCLGSYGQCLEEIRNGEPKGEWTKDMLDHLCDIWDRWHLNDMRAFCQHQKVFNWDKLARKEVTLYHYKLRNESLKKQEEAKKAAIAALKAGETFTPTKEQVEYANLSYSITVPDEIGEDMAVYYEPKKASYTGDQGPTETKTLGWLREEEHPDGILGKACPVCGYRYGSSWLREEVPEDVIEFLQKIPETKVRPAWV